MTIVKLRYMKPTSVETVNGEKYYLSITDDYAHFTIVYLLKSKSDTEVKLMEHIEQQVVTEYQE